MDELEAVGDPEVRDALLFARGRERPVTADELAARQGVHRNVARSRLERLVAAGLLEPGYERRTGRSGPGAGRPAKTYRVAPELEAIELPKRRYESLVALMIDALPARTRRSSLRDVGTAFAQELATAAGLRPARSLQKGLDSVCRAVRSLGYQASVESVDGTRAVIATPTCPLRPLVRQREDAVELDRGMWAGLVALAVRGASVDEVACETHDCLADHASCKVLIGLANSKN
jgi:predicted ArsR family transcriptional regulator